VRGMVGLWLPRSPRAEAVPCAAFRRKIIGLSPWLTNRRSLRLQSSNYTSEYIRRDLPLPLKVVKPVALPLKVSNRQGVQSILPKNLPKDLQIIPNQWLYIPYPSSAPENPDNKLRTHNVPQWTSGRIRTETYGFDLKSSFFNKIQ
jgi:hypothetical protein